MRTALRRCPAGAGVLRDAPGHESMRAAAPGCAGRPLQLFRALNRFPSIDDAENRLAARAVPLKACPTSGQAPQQRCACGTVLGAGRSTPFVDTAHLHARRTCRKTKGPLGP